jgi:hypothetical protein
MSKAIAYGDCRKIGEFWYSKKYLQDFVKDYEIIQTELEQVGIYQEKLLREGTVDIEKVRFWLVSLYASVEILRAKFEEMTNEAE